MPPSDLREQLERVRTMSDLSMHPKFVASLLDHRIDHIPPSDPRHPDYPGLNPTRYNCFAYALDLCASAKFRHAITVQYQMYSPDSKFINSLIAAAVVRKDPTSGHLVIYFHDHEPRHAGKLVGPGRVVSKWGYGLFWEHDFKEVPRFYGDDIWTFSFDPAKTEKAFLASLPDGGRRLREPDLTAP